MNLTFVDNGWNDYVFWQGEDKKIIKKINKLLDDIERNGEAKGTGKPEPLKGNLSGWWSRRIDEQNRLIYRIKDGCLEINRCRSHYGEK